MLDQDHLEEVHWFLNSQSFVKWVVLVSCFSVLVLSGCWCFRLEID
jgi:hypothetical protein